MLVTDAVRQRRAVAAGHDLDGLHPAVAPRDAAVLDVDDVAGGHQRVRADEPAGADPPAVVGRGDQQRRVRPPRIHGGVGDLHAVVGSVDGLGQRGRRAVGGGRDVGQVVQVARDAQLAHLGLPAPLVAGDAFGPVGRLQGLLRALAGPGRNLAPGDALRLGVVAVRDRRVLAGRGAGDGRARSAALPCGRGLGCCLLGRHDELRSVVVPRRHDKGVRTDRLRYEPPRGFAAQRVARGGRGWPELPGYGAGMSDPPPVDHSEPVVVATYVDLGEAEVAQAKLRAFGIEAVILDQAEGGVIPTRAPRRHRGRGAGGRRRRRLPHSLRHDRGLSQAGPAAQPNRRIR